MLQIEKPFVEKEDNDIEKQTECECGARMAKYMVNIAQSYSNKNENNISRIIGGTIMREKRNGSHEASKCRQEIKEKLEGEKRSRGLTYNTNR